MGKLAQLTVECNTILMAGSWLMALGRWLMADGSTGRTDASTCPLRELLLYNVVYIIYHCLITLTDTTIIQHMIYH